MASLILRKIVALPDPYDINDMGFSIVGGANTDFDLIHEDAENVSLSTDITDGISAGDLIVLDPRDNTTPLGLTDSLLAIQNHNLTHFGIQGGRFSDLDDPSGYVPTDKFILDYNTVTKQYEQIDPAVVISNNQGAVSSIVGGMVTSGADTTVVFDPTSTPLVDGQDETNYDGTLPNGEFTGGDGAGGTTYAPGDTITMSDGSIITVGTIDGNGDVATFAVTTVGTNATPGVPVTQVAPLPVSGGTGFELTPENPNIQQGSVVVQVDDSYLRNDGDVLDLGTLTIASGADITIAAGGDLIITDAPVNPTDATNKAYVDSVAQGLDAKESVQSSTTADLPDDGVSWDYANNGGVGDTITAVAVGTTVLDGQTLENGDRVLVKDQLDAKQNGIYLVSGADAGSATVLTRAVDQDGSPSSEVSAGNFTYVENGTVNGSSGWVTQGDGLLALNADNVDWVQFSGAGAYTTGPGLDQTGTVFSLDISTLTTDSIDLTDELAFGDTSGSDDNKITAANFLSDLNIVTSAGVGGFSVETSLDVFENRTLTVNGNGNLDGLAVLDGNGINGNPTFGLDIKGLPIYTSGGGTVDSVDRVAVWDADLDRNVYYTIQQISNATATTDSFQTWTGGGNTTGDASVAADDPFDTVILNGGNGININFNAAGDEVTFSFTDDGMVSTPVVLADTVPFFDTSNGGEAEFRAWSDIITDLGIATNIAASTDEDETGIVITGIDTIGLDIVGLTAAGDNMTATDEFIVHDKSEGTTGANGKITGQDIADGVEDILGINGITISTIDTQPVLTITDTTRLDVGLVPKQLSADSVVFTWGENRLSNLDWLQIGGNATDADSGFIMPMQGTVVYATGHTENGNGNTKDMHLFIDGVDKGSIGQLSGASEQQFDDNTINLDFTKGQKLRVRAVGSGTGDIEDTVVSIFVKWRA